MLTKVSPMRVTIPIDLSTRTFIPLPRFFRSRQHPLILPFPWSYFLNALPMDSMVSAMESRVVLVDINRAMGKDLEVVKT